MNCDFEWLVGMGFWVNGMDVYIIKVWRVAWGFTLVIT